MATDQCDVPLDPRKIRAGETRAEPGVEEDFGIPGSEEARGLGTGPLPPRREDGRDRPQPEQQIPDDRIVVDRDVAVDGGRDRDEP